MLKISKEGRGRFLAQSLERRGRKTVSVRRYVVERLEHRTLLSTTVVISSTGSSGAFQFPDATIECETVPTPASTSNPQITGTFSVYWWNGQEAPGGGAEPGGSPLATASLQPFGPNGGGYVTFEDVPLSPAAAAAAGPITNDSVNGPVYKLVFIYNGGNYPATTAGPVAEVLAGSASVGQLTFIQNPSNTAAGDTITPPVTVAVEDSSGNFMTSASDIVTLAIASGTGTLSGTVSEPAVNGIATFSDLSINAEGGYTLTASDTTTSSTTPATSSLFSITGGKLVFVPGKTPTDGSAGEPLNPIEVELQDGKGNIDTTNSTTVVTLSPIGFTSGNPVTGNTATLVNGVATFSNVVLAKPGFYQLQAADGGDATSATPKFKVTGDHLMINDQPKAGDVNISVPLVVELLNGQNKPDTSATSSAVLSLNTLSGGVGAALSGTSAVQFAGGIAAFTAAAGPTINAPGKYTFSITEEDYSTGVLTPTNTTTAITSAQFSIAGYHLAFLKPPVPTDVATPLSFNVEVEDAKKRVQTNVNSGGVTLSFARGAGATGQMSSYTDAGFVNGVDTFSAPTSPSFNFPGSYTLTATQIDNTGAAVDGTATGSATAKILGLHIEIVVPPPSTVPLHKFLAMKLEVEDSKGKLDATVSDYLTIGGTALPSGVPLVPFEPAVSPQFVNGVCEFVNSSQLTGYHVSFENGLATTTLTFGATFVAFGQMNDPAVATAKSRPIRVTGFHIAFLNQPANVSVGGVIPVAVAIEDDHNVVLKPDDTESATLPQESAQIQSNPIGVARALQTSGNFGPVLFADGEVNFPLDSQDGSLPTLVAPYLPQANVGKYTLTAAAILNDSSGQPIGPDPDIKPATSHAFRVLPLHLAFQTQPQGISVSFILPAFSVQVESDDDELQSTQTNILLDASYRLVSGGPSQMLGQATLTNGVADFKLNQITDPGTYKITVVEDPSPTNLQPGLPAYIPVTSLPFKMSP